jgi:phosphoenolpyruvate carboxykinase (GTP)
MRVLKWVVGRARGEAGGVETPLGIMPRYTDMDWRGLEFTPEQFAAVMGLDRDLWLQEIGLHDSLFAKLAERLPSEMLSIRDLYTASLKRMPEKSEPLTAAGIAE